MLIRIFAVFMIAIGILGLLLPLIPGIFLIIMGILLFYNGRLHELRKYIPERMPASGAIAYDMLVAKLLSPYYELVAGEIPALAENELVLDVGTGPGILPMMIAKRSPGAKITGIDLSEKMIELANRNRAKAAKSQGAANIEFKIMDANSLALADNSMDFVISTGALHHWRDQVKVLNELYRCLKPGKEAWLYDGRADAKKSDIHEGTKRFLNMMPPCNLIKYMLHIHGYTDKEYESLINEAVTKSEFKACSLERRGMMMRVKLKK